MLQPMASDTPGIRVAARALIFDPEGRLLVQFYQDGPERWCTTPGGGIERGERLDDGLRREIHEELGIEISIGPLRYVRELRGNTGIQLLGGLSPDFHQLEHFFEVTSFRGIPAEGHATDNYASGFAWLPLSELADQRFFPNPLGQRLASDREAGFPEGAVYLGDA